MLFLIQETSPAKGPIHVAAPCFTWLTDRAPAGEKGKLLDYQSEPERSLSASVSAGVNTDRKSKALGLFNAETVGHRDAVTTSPMLPPAIYMHRGIELRLRHHIEFF